MKKNKVDVKNKLIKEKEELDKKLMNLNNFIRSVDFVSLGDLQKRLMTQQSVRMVEYSEILRDRIVDITSQEAE